jgi:DtxR family manganese transport transcriptional regulator
VTHATVAKMIGRLQAAGLVRAQPYRAVFLTEEGRDIAERSRRRHQIVVAALRSIGVSEKTAQADAEGLEHHCSAETLAALERLAKRRR